MFLRMLAQETDDCILWPYAVHGGGYGLVAIDPTHKESAHRLAWMMTRILKGKKYRRDLI
jgi:hypothetical protein